MIDKTLENLRHCVSRKKIRVLAILELKYSAYGNPKHSYMCSHSKIFRYTI